MMGNDDSDEDFNFDLDEVNFSIIKFVYVIS
jgi:hypothetical protein